MAFKFEFISFAINNATGQQIEALTQFSAGEPAKAVIIWSTDHPNGTDGYATIGLGVSSTRRGSIGICSEHNVPTSDCTASHFNDALFTRYNEASGLEERVDLNGFGASGTELDLQVLTAVTAGGSQVFALVLGGSDFDCRLHDWTTPTAQGSHSETVEAGFQGEAAVSICAEQSAFNVVANAYTLHVALWDGTNEEIISLRERNNQGVSAAKCDRWTGEAHHLLSSAGSNRGQATFTSWDANGFTLNFGPPTPVARVVQTLVMKGVDFEVFNFNTPTTATPPTQNIVKTLSITPELALFFGNSTNGGEDQANAILSMGAADGTNDRSQGYAAEDANTQMNVHTELDTVKSFKVYDQDLFMLEEADATFSGNDITFAFSTSDVTQRLGIGIAFGAAAAAAFDVVGSSIISTQTLGEATNAYNQLADSLISTQTLGEATTSHNAIGSGTISSQTLGEATTAYNVAADAVVSTQTLGEATTAFNPVADSVVSTQTLGEATNAYNQTADSIISTQTLGEATNAYNQTADSIISTQTLGEATEDLGQFDVVGSSIISTQTLGEATTSFNETAGALISTQTLGEATTAHNTLASATISTQTLGEARTAHNPAAAAIISTQTLGEALQAHAPSGLSVLSTQTLGEVVAYRDVIGNAIISTQTLGDVRVAVPLVIRTTPRICVVPTEDRLCKPTKSNATCEPGKSNPLCTPDG